MASEQKRPGGGLVILNPSKNAVLLIRDDRTQKWSFPKGRYEIYDADLLATAIRETEEETGFVLNKDYVLDNSVLRSYANTQLVLAYSLTDALPFQVCAEHHVAEVAWVPFEKIARLNHNLPLRLWAKKEGWIRCWSGVTLRAVA
jgi:8-oxo-dGTP pyrophosphatase MutT (NUDIX family)